MIQVCVCVYNFVFFSIVGYYNIFTKVPFTVVGPCHLSVFFMFFNCSIIVLQCCICFCCTIKWISYMYTHIPLPLESPSHSFPHPTYLGHHRAQSCAPCVYSSFALAICFTHDSVCTSMPLSQFIPPSPSPTVSTLEKMFLTVYSWVSWGAKERKCLPSVWFSLSVSMQNSFSW